MKKKMGCKAHDEDETAAALVAVRISSRRATQQTAFSSPRPSDVELPAILILRPQFLE